MLGIDEQLMDRYVFGGSSSEAIAPPAPSTPPPVPAPPPIPTPPPLSDAPSPQGTGDAADLLPLVPWMISRVTVVVNMAETTAVSRANAAELRELEHFESELLRTTVAKARADAANWLATSGSSA